MNENFVKVDQKVKIDGSSMENIDVKMVFKNRQIMVSPWKKSKSHLIFESVPKGEKVYIVGLKKMDTGGVIPSMALVEIVTGEEDVVLDWKPVKSFEEINAKLKLFE